MSWALRRQIIVVIVVLLFLFVVIGIPVLLHVYASRTIPCPSGSMRAPDATTGPCQYLDEHLLSPYSVLWKRAFLVRGSTYSALAYIENPNKDAGVRSVHYHFSFYDSKNVLVAEREGDTYIMPGGVTPVFESGIDAGYRPIVRTDFCFTAPGSNCDAPYASLVWERMQSDVGALKIQSTPVSDPDSAPRLGATVSNISSVPIDNLGFVAIVYDLAGNAINASATTLPSVDANSSQPIGFTWPQSFGVSVGHAEIVPSVQPVPAPVSTQ